MLLRQRQQQLCERLGSSRLREKCEARGREGGRPLRKMHFLFFFPCFLTTCICVCSLSVISLHFGTIHFLSHPGCRGGEGVSVHEGTPVLCAVISTQSMGFFLPVPKPAPLPHSVTASEMLFFTLIASKDSCLWHNNLKKLS